MENKTGSSKIARRGNWGYFFLIPFVVVFIIFQFIPLVTTVYNSFFENYRSGLKQVGPNFVGLDNFAALISSGDLFMYFKNTMIMWILGFVPQIVVSLVLSAWFTDPSLRLKEIFQDRDLSSQPDHGIGIFHAVFHLICRQRSDQCYVDARRYFQECLQCHVTCLECTRAGRLYELPDVVRQYNDPAYGGYDGNRPVAF